MKNTGDSHNGRDLIDRDSFVPLYYQLHELLKQQIESGAWKPDEMLPSENQLREQFGVSRVVVRKALEVLRNDHQVYSLQGKGTFVGQPKIEYDGGGLSRLLTREPEPMAVLRILECRTAVAEARVRRELGLKRGAAVLRVVWVWSVRNVPAVLGDSHFAELSPQDFLDALGADTPPCDIDATRVKWPYELAPLRISVEVGHAGSFSVEHLSVLADAPLFLISVTESIVGSDEDTPLEFARLSLRSDALTISLEKGGSLDGMGITMSAPY